MKNHEKSKKHREMVTLLRQQLENEENSLGLNLEGMERGDGENEQENEEEEEEEVEDRPRQKYEAASEKQRLVAMTIRTQWHLKCEINVCNWWRFSYTGCPKSKREKRNNRRSYMWVPILSDFQQPDSIIYSLCIFCLCRKEGPVCLHVGHTKI